MPTDHAHLSSPPLAPAAGGRTEADQLRDLAHGRPPFTSIYLPIDRHAEDGPQRIATAWREGRAELAAADAPDPILERADALVAELHDGATLAMVFDGDGNEHVRAIAHPLAAPWFDHGPIPRLGPLLVFARDNPAYVVALLDRRGADIVSVVDRSLAEEHVVDGDDGDPLTKSAPGGWSQRRYQQRAENTWERNAAEVAEELADAARQVGAAVVIVAGEERMARLLDDHLPAEIAARCVRAESGGRAVDGSVDELRVEVERLVATVVATHMADTLRHFVELRDRGAIVADGPGATFEALRAAMVDTLLVHDEPDDDRRAWFDLSSPTLVAGEAATLRDLGFEPLEGRMVDVLVWAALGTGAQVEMIPGRGPRVPAEGVGAFLRGSIEPTDPE